MNLISNKHKVTFVGYTILIFVVYVSLVLIDVLVAFGLGYIDGTQAQYEEYERFCQQDIEMVEEAKKKGFRSLVYPELYEYPPFRQLAEKYGVAPLAPQPNQEIYYCNEGYGQLRYKSDRFGFRNDDSIWNRVIHTALIGDSFVHGACVDEVSTASGGLIAKGVTAVNFGTASNSPIHYAAIAKEFIRVAKPKNVVIVFYANDNVQGEESSVFNQIFFKSHADYFSWASDGLPNLSKSLSALYSESADLEKSISESLDLEREESKQKCINESEFEANLIKFFKSSFGHLKFESSRKVVGLINTAGQRNQSSSILPFGSRLAIDTLKAECQKHKCKALIVYVPNSKYWRPDGRAEGYAKLLKEYSASQGVEFTDLTFELSELGKNAYAISGPHLSPVGYQVLSNSIYRKITH